MVRVMVGGGHQSCHGGVVVDTWYSWVKTRLSYEGRKD